MRKSPLKLLIVTSVLDLRLPYGGANVWWHLLTALYEHHVDLLVTVYQGRTIPSPYWESYENPCYWEGYAFAKLKKWRQRVFPADNEKPLPHGDLTNKATLAMTRTLIRPRWRKHILNIMDRNRDIDAVLFINLPLNQLRGIPTAIHERYDLPVIFYDSDLPVSLPDSHGFRSGFQIYDDADLSEYDLFLCPSIGGAEKLKALGAPMTRIFLFAANPLVCAPMPIPEQDIDVFFYGFAADGRKDWMRWMLTEPSQQMSNCYFALRGQNFHFDLGNTHIFPDIPVSRLRNYCCRSKINLNIVRDGHASVYGSSTTRPFELAAMECCTVCNPYPGLEEWLEPEKEIFMVNTPEEVLEVYQWLLSHEATRQKVGRQARQRILQEHTYQHRAKQLVQIVGEFTN